MNVLFISFAEVSLSRGSVRSVAMLRALADAGHRVDLIAPAADLPDHPQIRILMADERRPRSRFGLAMRCLRATGRGSYDAIHAVDDAVFFASRLGRWKNIPVVYDATRRFSGAADAELPFFWKLFPRHLRQCEIRVLDRAKIVFSSCAALSSDLFGMNKDTALVQLADIPLQPLVGRTEAGTASLLCAFDPPPSTVILCTVLTSNPGTIRKVLMAARKVIEAVPTAAFFFRGVDRARAEGMAASLDISSRCVFLPQDDLAAFLTVLEAASAVLMVPARACRYVHPEVYSLLHSGTPLVAVQNAAYDDILTAETCIGVLDGSDSIAEGILRAIQEPLFSLAIATAGQQLMADCHAYSSFKHKIRMTYHQVFKND